MKSHSLRFVAIPDVPKTTDCLSRYKREPRTTAHELGIKKESRMVQEGYPELRAYLRPMPGTVKAFSVQVDDFTTIVVNENLNEATRLKAYKHEIDHIRSGDFDRDDSVSEIEMRAHGL